MNRVVHFEIHAKDKDALQKFYEDVFGWNFIKMGADLNEYRVIMTGPGPNDSPDPKNPGINGGMTSRMGDLPKGGEAVNSFVNIIGVEDAAATVEKITAAGGTIAFALMDVPGVGKLAYAKDPEGNLFGVLTPVAM